MGREFDCLPIHPLFGRFKRTSESLLVAVDARLNVMNCRQHSLVCRKYLPFLDSRSLQKTVIAPSRSMNLKAVRLADWNERQKWRCPQHSAPSAWQGATALKEQPGEAAESRNVDALPAAALCLLRPTVGARSQRHGKRERRRTPRCCYREAPESWHRSHLFLATTALETGCVSLGRWLQWRRLSSRTEGAAARPESFKSLHAWDAPAPSPFEVFGF